ncbi:MAG: hypothetical protein LC790_11215 [Actinobacteria bacterium]|nr:hypothetical protein [Actinomycetota bacterium]
MNDKPEGSQNSPKMGLAALGIGAFAVVCCAGLPLVAGVLGGVALGSVLGVGAGALAVIVVIVLVVARARRQRACATTRRGGQA